MFSLLSDTAQLAIKTRQRVNLISVEHEHESQSNGPAREVTIQGKVNLTLKKPMKLKSLYVKIVAKANVKAGEHYGSATLVERKVSTGCPDMVQEGSWMFPFDIPIATTSPPSISSTHGRVTWQIVAVASGLGRFGGDLEAYEPIEVIVAPAFPGFTPPSLEFDIEAPVHEIGRFRSSLVAGWANIGVLALAYLNFNGPPVDAQILEYKASIAEHCIVTNVEEPHQTVTMPVVHAPIFSYKGTPLFELKAEQSFEHGPTWARLPSHQHIHPSTDELTESPIRFSHEVVVSFSFKTALSDEVRTIVQSAKCFLYSCTAYDRLPTYEGFVSQKFSHAGMCECEISMEREMEECRDLLLARSYQKRQQKAF